MKPANASGSSPSPPLEERAGERRPSSEEPPPPGVWTRDTVTTCTGIGFAQIRLVTCHVTNRDNQNGPHIGFMLRPAGAWMPPMNGRTRADVLRQSPTPALSPPAWPEPVSDTAVCC